MPKNYSDTAPNAVRRRDRAIEDQAWMRTFLCRAPIGVLATVHEGQPFINSNLFVYDEAAHVIYMHTARVGRTQANVEKDEKVCFSISEMGRLLPADTALEFSAEYAGVTVFGRAKIVTEKQEASRGLQLLLDKYAPHLKPDIDYQGITEEERKRTAVYRIEIDQWSGKRKQVAPDFPGAYLFDDVQ